MKKQKPHNAGRLTQQLFDEINTLYYDEGWTQKDIAERFGYSSSGYISRVINGIYQPNDNKARAHRLIQLNQNIHSLSSEPKQAKSLRSKREQLHSTKLTFKKAQRIRQSYFKTGKVSQMILALRFGVSQSTIHRVVLGLAWKENL